MTNDAAGGGDASSAIRLAKNSARLPLQKSAEPAYLLRNNHQEFKMAKGNNSHKKETKKPKKEKPKAPPSTRRGA